MSVSPETGRLAGRITLVAAAVAMFVSPLHAETRSAYDLSYTPGRDALSTLDVFSGADSLRPGFRNDVQRGRELNVEVRSMQMPSVASPGAADRGVETRGGFIQHFGGTGFGYGVDLGVGLGSSGNADAWLADDAFAGSSSFVVTDLSTGPTYQTGNLESRVRVGVRYPLLGEPDAATAFHGHRGDTWRSAGYLSLDSKLRFSNQTEMSLSLFYDDYGLGSSRDWLSDRLDFQGGGGSTDSVIGFEMGLNF